MTEPPASLLCRTYTRARRHPAVIGRIGGWVLPTGPLTIPQIALALGAFAALVQTWAIWAHLGFVANTIVLVSVPFAIGRTARHVRVEGRSPHRAAMGFAALLWSRPVSFVSGHAVAGRRAVLLRSHLFVSR